MTVGVFASHDQRPRAGADHRDDRTGLHSGLHSEDARKLRYAVSPVPLIVVASMLAGTVIKVAASARSSTQLSREMSSTSSGRATSSTCSGARPKACAEHLQRRTPGGGVAVAEVSAK